MSGVRRKLMTWAAFSLGLLLVSSMCGYLVRAMSPRPERYQSYPTRYAPQTSARADLVSRAAPAFGRAMTPTPADSAEFAPVFDSLAAAARAGDGHGCAALWDNDRTAEEVWALVAKWTRTVPTDLQVRGTAREVRETTASQGRDRTGLFRFDRTELLKVTRSRDGREALVVARHTATEDGVPAVHGARWWLVRNPGGAWKVYDRDVPRGRMRATVRLAGHEWQSALGLGSPGAGFGPSADEGLPQTLIGAVEQALALPFDGSRIELELALAEHRSANLPPPWAAARAVAEANLHVKEGEPRKAMSLLNEAARLDPTNPLTHLVRAAAANRLGDHKAVIQSVSVYRNAVGPDPDAILQLGLALEKTERSTPAMREYRAALKDFPGHDPLYPALARTLPAGQKREAGELAAKGPRPADHLDAILSAPEADDLALADEVVAGFLAARPDDPRGLTAAAIVRVRQRRVPEAAAFLRQAREVTPDDERVAIRLIYVGEVLRHGLPVAGYNAVPPADRSAVFRRLAAALQTRRGPQLELIAAHRAAAPTDPWGKFWLAELLASRGRPEPAEELLAAAMANLPKPTRTTRTPRSDRSPVRTLAGDEATWDQFRTLRAMYLLELGRWKDAYHELPPAVDTFDQLVFALDEAGDAAGLAELVAMHKKAVPDDAEAIFWQGQVHWLRKETEKAVELFAEYRTAAGEAAGQKWRADGGRVRGLVRLGRADEARQVLEGSDVAVGVLPLQALVAAAVGDAERVAVVFAEWVAQGASPRALYADPDLGPLLRGDRFAELRAKYPPP
jgi:tetratricopeptide (TPR) repeat protein